MDIEPGVVDHELLEVARAIREAGGRALVVGGFVRDRRMGLESKDHDVEVYGLSLAGLEPVLRRFGEVIAVGRSFGVLRVKGLDVDFSLPRRDSKTGPGHRGFRVELDPGLDYAEAARRRDLTINAMAYDPLSGEILDPFDGRGDLERGVLRATDPARFPEDSLRGLRVAQFRARFEMEPDKELHRLCASLDLSDLPGERIAQELRKLLLKGRRPSLGFEFLRQTRLLRFLPELAAMVGVPQDPEWHPEGDVWTHVMLVVDAAAGLRTGDEERDAALMYAALCHDLGKAETTHERDGRIRSPKHESAGVEPTEAFLGRLRCSRRLVDKVVALVRHHLAPTLLPADRASPKAYRRLARKLAAADVEPRELWRLARADHLGRHTADAAAGDFELGEEFLRRMDEVAREEAAIRDAVQGRHVLARGIRPGPGVGEVLGVCREVQDETGWKDPERILDEALARMERDRHK